MQTNFTHSDNIQNGNISEPFSPGPDNRQRTSILQPLEPMLATRQLPRVLNKFDLFTFSALTTIFTSPIILSGQAGYSALIYWIFAFLCILPYIIVVRWISLRINAQGGQCLWFSLLGGTQWGTIARLFFWLWGLFAIMSSLVGCLIILHLYAAHIFHAPIEEFGTLLILMCIIVILSLLPLQKLKGVLFVMLILSITMFSIAGLTGYWWILNGHPPMTSLSTLRPGPNNIGFFGVALWGLTGGDAPFIMMHEVKEQNFQKARSLGNFIWWSYGLVFGLYLFATLGTTLIISQPDKLVPAQTSILTIERSFGVITYYAILFLGLVFFVAKAVIFVLISSRLLFMSGREGVLPEKLTYTNRHGTPIVSILVQMAVCATFIFILYILLTGITNFNPITTQQGIPFYLLLRAISTILWILAVILFLAMSMRYIQRVRHKSHTSRRDEQIQGREGTWIFGLSACGIVALIICLQQVIAHSWVPGTFSSSHWSLSVITCTLVAVVIGWLCAEIPRKQTLLTTLRKVNTREQSLRNQLEEAYHEQQILVEQQQELLVAVEQLYRENALAAVTDPITALPNHRAIISALDDALQDTQEKRESMGLLFVDLDRFKQVNDSWGHPAGDAVLHEVGSRLKKAIGAGNFVGRYGGEEFAILLRKCDVTQAIEVAEKMRLSIMEKPYLWYAEDTSTPVELTITASIGISLAPYHGETREALLEQADRAMYRAKQSGRNRVCIVLAEGQTRQILTVRGLGSFSSEEICTARALLAAMQAYDQETYEHAQRMVSLSEATARRLKCGSEEIHNVRLAAMFHDIGKVGVPNSILHKPGPLTDSEWEVIRRHPDTGRRILARAGGPFTIVAYIIGAHHERWDGDGYPGGLAGEQIPLPARILSVVDAYDTMVSGRVYREAISDKEAREELLRCAGSQFDTNVVDAFLQSLDNLEATSHEPFISQRAS